MLLPIRFAAPVTRMTRPSREDILSLCGAKLRDVKLAAHLLTFALVPFGLLLHAQRVQKAELVQAAESGDLLQVRRLLAAGANPNVPKSFSALQAASAAALPEIVREMLKYHADVRQRDSAGRTALNVLALSAVADPKESPAEVAQLLIDAGADVNTQDNIYGNTALHEVPTAATAKVLIAAGARINLQNQDGQTALMLTLDQDVARVLVDAGADVTLRDNRSKTALDLARELALTEKIALLESGKK